MATVMNFQASPIGAALALPGEALFQSAIDETVGIIRTSGRGRLTIAQAEDFVAELLERADEVRRRVGRVRILYDRRGGEPQSDRVVECFADAYAQLFAERDRFAVVVDSSLVKSQLRLRFVHAGSQAFLSYSAAELWLTAWS